MTITKNDFPILGDVKMNPKTSLHYSRFEVGHCFFLFFTSSFYERATNFNALIIALGVDCPSVIFLEKIEM